MCSHEDNKKQPNKPHYGCLEGGCLPLASIGFLIVFLCPTDACYVEEEKNLQARWGRCQFSKCVYFKP